MATKSLSPGQAGGRAVVRIYGKDHMRRIGLKGAAKGGRAVVRKYGNEYMSLLGQLGNDAQNNSLTPNKRNRINSRIRKIVNSAN